MALSFLEYMVAISLGAFAAGTAEGLTGKSKVTRYAALVFMGAVMLVGVYQWHPSLIGFWFFFWVVLTYLQLSLVTGERENIDELKEKVKREPVEPMVMRRRFSRLLTDIVIVGGLSLGMIAYWLYDPYPYSFLSVIIPFYLLTIIVNLIKRVVLFFTTQCYYNPEKQCVYIVSRAAPRELPIKDLKHVHTESKPDVLKLHPLFLVFSTRLDYTTNRGRVLCLTFPGEQYYLTLQDPEVWKERLAAHQHWEREADERNVLPFWEPKRLKRWIGNIYFAVSVKGISVYATLFVILYELNASEWTMAMVIVSFWLFNLMISDRLLITAMDVVPLRQRAIRETAECVFRRAGLRGVRLFVTETPLHNAVAAGVRSSRGVIVLTSSLLRLPKEDLEAIVAHEAVHIKKRDMLWVQLEKVGWLVLVVLLLFFFRETGQAMIRDMTFFSLILIMVGIWLVPVLFSLISQWREVRADHLGARWILGGSGQMAKALYRLARYEEVDQMRALSYAEGKKEPRHDRRMTERPSWLQRGIEFQFFIHPPLYWRIASLQAHDTGWGFFMWWRWLTDRVKESLPDRIRMRS